MTKTFYWISITKKDLTMLNSMILCLDNEDQIGPVLAQHFGEVFEECVYSVDVISDEQIEAIRKVFAPDA